LAIYITYSNIQKIIEQIDLFIKENGFIKVDEEKREPNKNIIKAEGNVSKKPIEIIWEIEPYGNSNSLKMEVKPENELRKEIIFRNLLFTLLLIILPILFIKIFTNSDKVPIIVIFFIVFFLACILDISHAIFKILLTKVEVNFRKSIKGILSIRLESPIKIQLIPPEVNLVVKIILSFVCMYYLHEIFPLLFYPALPLLVLIISFILISYLGLKDRYLIWKAILISNEFRWTLFICSIIFCLFIFYLFNSFILVSYENVSSGKQIPYKESFTNAYFERSLQFFKQSYKDPIIFRIKLIQDIINKKVEGQDPDLTSTSIDIFKKYSTLQILIYGMSMIVFSLVAVGAASQGLFKISEEWQSYVAEDLPTPIKPPSLFIKSKLSSFMFFPLLSIWIIFAVIVNYLFALVSIDIISYIFTDSTLIFKELSVLFSWVPTVFVLYSKTYYPGKEALFIGISKGFLMLLAFPFIYIFFKRILNIIMRIIKGIYEYFHKTDIEKVISSEVKEAICEISKISALRFPNIRVIKSKKIKIYSKISIVSRRATIYVNRNILNDFNDKELVALFAHELAHVKRDLKKLSILKIISRILLFPNYFLVLFMNFRKMEELADEFAIKATKNKEDLKYALIRFIALSLFDGKRVKKKSNKESEIPNYAKISMKEIFVIDEFCFGESLIGYSHPEILERLKEIEKAY